MLFPLISNLRDVENHLDDNFTVKESEEAIYINYLLANETTFPKGNMTRREFRGIAFHPVTKDLISRPFHKFFNLDEREDAVWRDVDHIIMEKLDGSMVRPIPTKDGIRLATKAGITDVAMMAEKYLDDRYLNFMQKCLDSGITPIFEFVSPENKIVLDYEKPKLILLTLRHNFTGTYIQYFGTEVPVVKQSSLKPEQVKDLEGEEGIVIKFYDGDMLKVKSDWYVKLHYAKELMSREKTMVGYIINNELDDILTHLMPEDELKIREYESDFWDKFYRTTQKLDGVYHMSRNVFSTKKDYAIANARYGNPFFNSFVFDMWDNKTSSSKEFLVSYINKKLNSNFNQVKEVLSL